MRSILYVAALGLVCFVAIWAYQVINDTRVLLEDVERLHTRIARERESISVLRAEWAWLNRPERLERLAEINADTLGLAPMTPDHFGAATAVAFQPPPPHAPGPAPAPLRSPNLAVFAMAGGPLGGAEAAVETRGPAAPVQAPNAAAMAAAEDADKAPDGPQDPAAATSGPSPAPAFDAPAAAPEPDGDAGALVAGLDGLSQGMRRDLGEPVEPASDAASEAPVQVASLDAGAAAPAPMSEADLIQSLVMQAQGGVWMPPPRPAGR